MKIQKFKHFLTEAIEDDLTQRVQALEQTRAQVNAVVTQAQAIAALNDEEAIDTRLDALAAANAANDDSMVSLALTFARKVADRKKLELRIQAYEEEIPDLENQLDERMQGLMDDIRNLRTEA